MRRSECVVFAGAVLCTAALGQLAPKRMFFDTTGADEQAPRSTGSPAFENPTLVGSGRLYLYIEYGLSAQDFSACNFEIRVTGPGQITGGTFYNHQSTTGLDRWGTITHKDIINGTYTDAGGTFTIPGPIWRWGNVFKIGTAGFGMKNVASNGTSTPDVEDTHFSRVDGSLFGTTLLGYIEVESTASTPADVFICNGGQGLGPHRDFPPYYDDIFFGFGDAAVPDGPGATFGGPGGPSALPDAHISPVPEPAGLLLVVVGTAACVLRRR